MRRNDAWSEAFYKIFLEVRAEENPTFGDVLHRIYDATHCVEASFCSKMLAESDTSRPIWDSRMKEIIKMYDAVCRCYEEYLHTPKLFEMGIDTEKIAEAVEYNVDTVRQWIDAGMAVAK